MELHYYKHTDEPDVEYITWEFIEPLHSCFGSPGSWKKLSTPIFTTLQGEKGREWYRTSNREDLHFVTMELRVAQTWARTHLDEIKCAMDYDNKHTKNDRI